MKINTILMECLYEERAINLYKRVRRRIPLPKTSFYRLVRHLGEKGLLEVKKFGKEIWVEPTERGLIYAIQRLEGVEHLKMIKGEREVNWILTKCPSMTPVVSLADFPPFYPNEKDDHYYAEISLSDGLFLYKVILKISSIDGGLFNPSRNLNATWFIAQDGVGWWGIGPLNFLKAILNSEQRYREVEKERLHHTELYMYVSRLSENAIAIISGEIEAGSGIVRNARLTIITNGIYYRLPALDDLLQIYDREIPIGFKKYLNFDMRQTLKFPLIPDEKITVDVQKEAKVGGILSRKPIEKGFIAKNILHRFEDQFGKMVKSKVLQLEKTFYHIPSIPPSEGKITYQIRGVETFYVPRAGLVLHITADWLSTSGKRLLWHGR